MQTTPSLDTRQRIRSAVGAVLILLGFLALVAAATGTPIPGIPDHVSHAVSAHGAR